MISVDLYNIKGEKIGNLDLPEDVFGLESNDALLHQVYVAQAANRRSGSAHTKNRSAVRGGGRKPWKQKGTGNARTGSIRNPIWRGGGIVFGPTKHKNYKKNVNIKMRKRALFVAISEKIRNNKFLVVDSLNSEEVKTKVFKNFFHPLGLCKFSSIVGLASNEREMYKAIRNLEKKNAVEVDKFNVYDLLNSQYVVVSKDGVEVLKEKFTSLYN